jgi:hypothetical protein
MLTGDPTQAFAGILIDTLGTADTLIEVVAGADVQPLLVTLKLG